MIAAAVVAAAAIHLSGPSPEAQLSAVERVAPFHVLVLPPDIDLLRADLGRDLNGAVVHLAYSSVGTEIDVDERLPQPSDAPGAVDDHSEAFSLDGFPAIYRETGPAYHPASSLTWYRGDLTIELSSRDGADAPMLVDIALELR